MLLGKANAIVDELEAEILAPLGAADRTRLIALLRRLTRHSELPDNVHPGIRRRPTDGDRPQLRPPRG